MLEIFFSYLTPINIFLTLFSVICVLLLAKISVKNYDLYEKVGKPSVIGIMAGIVVYILAKLEPVYIRYGFYSPRSFTETLIAMSVIFYLVLLTSSLVAFTDNRRRKRESAVEKGSQENKMNKKQLEIRYDLSKSLNVVLVTMCVALAVGYYSIPSPYNLGVIVALIIILFAFLKNLKTVWEDYKKLIKEYSDDSKKQKK